MSDFYHKSVKKSRSFYIDIFLIVAAVVVLVLVIINHSCKTAGRPGHNAVTVTISSQCENLLGKDMVSAVIQEFEKQYPDLRIQIAVQDESAVADGADIIFLDDTELADLINSSAFASLDPYMHTETQNGQWTTQWVHPWVVPLVSFVDLFFYNIDILEAADCDRPPKTRAEFLEAAKAVAKSNPSLPWQAASVSAFAVGLDPADPLALRRDLYPWIWADGGEIYLPATADKPAALSRTAVNTLSFFEQLNSEGLLAPQSLEKTGAQRLEEFAQGKIAMILTSAQNIAFLRQNAPDLNFGITTIPTTARGKSRLGLSGIYAGINSDCTQPDEAWAFLTFIAGKTQVLAEALGAVPGNFPSTFPGEYIEKDTHYTKAWDIFEAADILGYHPHQPTEEAINDIVWEKLEEIFRE